MIFVQDVEETTCDMFEQTDDLPAALSGGTIGAAASRAGVLAVHACFRDPVVSNEGTAERMSRVVRNAARRFHLALASSSLAAAVCADPTGHLFPRCEPLSSH